MHAYGQLLALDPGYLSYNRRAEVGNASNHNMLLVDGTGPDIGTSGAANDAPATIQRTFSTPQLSYGEVQTAYKEATITRKSLFIRDAYYLLADVVTAPTDHTFTWQLHGYGLEGGTPATGEFQNKFTGHEGIWTKNGVSLLAHVTAAGLTAYSTATNTHEVVYNVTENHTTMLVESTGAQAQFLAALYPHVSVAPTISTISTTAMAGLTNADGHFNDIAFSQADTILVTGGTLGTTPVSSDALLTFYSCNAAGEFAQAFLEQGKLLRDGDNQVLSSSRRASISWQKVSARQYAGYVSRSTVLLLNLAEAPLSLTGPGVDQYTYDAANQQLSIVFTEASNFQVQLSASRPLPVELVHFTATRQANGVQLVWQTATELQNHGFTVERRAITEAAFHPVSFVPGQGTTSVPFTYRYQDSAAPTSEVYYRLRQQDQNGSFTYSSVAVVKGQPKPLPTLTVVPVPARSHFTVQYSGVQQNVRLHLLDQSGRIVLQQHFQDQTQISVGHLPAGVYFLQPLDANTGQLLAKPQRVLIAP
ncbi:T9SS type A sorting domain-containing protein [Hymenobacter sp. 5414T-23]|uniref:T9SS type A sorting domain-containing protein n=1 Tax=Hymenobacter sp. 5414T-23 TaxID=2932252 RepID=UPI001FD0EAEE|nr:T9SS type A sorting domain-containing protein [Hymenobacter sp. 5414T-23]UOQ83128.1 T9SS type A sorting domain-containing protein [Hymenobacter sp. 5414T-23]